MKTKSAIPPTRTAFDLQLSVQYADEPDSLAAELTRSRIRRWVKAAQQGPAQLTIRFVGTAEARELNRQFRQKDYATNVLTFSYTEDLPEAVRKTLPDSADLVLCSDVLRKEAAEQNKLVLHHAAHLIVHGVLHAHGFDHQDDTEAETMEALEVTILQQLAIDDPYRSGFAMQD